MEPPPAPKPVVRSVPLPPAPIGSSRPAPAPVLRRSVPVAVPRVEQSESESDLLSNIAQQANAGDIGQARASCQRYLAQFAPKAQVYYWLGLLSDTEGDAAQALTHYRKALYLDPQHPEALLHLATLLAAQGDEAGARRLQERAARAGREAER